TVAWQKLTRSDLAGYKIWRKTNDNTTPSITDSKYATINDPTITSFTEQGIRWGGNLVPGNSYYYWIKGFTYDGNESASFSPTVTGRLRTAPPAQDTAISGNVIDGSI